MDYQEQRCAYQEEFPPHVSKADRCDLQVDQVGQGGGGEGDGGASAAQMVGEDLADDDEDAHVSGQGVRGVEQEEHGHRGRQTRRVGSCFRVQRDHGRVNREPGHAESQTGHQEWTAAQIVCCHGSNDVENRRHGDPAGLEAELGVDAVSERRKNLLALCFIILLIRKAHFIAAA